MSFPPFSINPAPFQPVLVGVSGGADSLCLLDALHRSGVKVIAAHFDHQLREDSAADAAFVAEIAAGMGIPCRVGRGNVAGFAAQAKLSTEEAARKLRYRFLFEQARALGAGAVAVAHTADDQAETMLMHFLRGAGLPGLKGMLPQTTLAEFDPALPLLRPLLGWFRADTEVYCREHNLAFRVDSTNRDETYLRNQLRHTLIPQLEEYNPAFKTALLRASQAMQGDFEIVQQALDAAWEKVDAQSANRFVAFDHAKLAKLSVPVRRGLLRRAAFMLYPGLRDMDFDALQRAASLQAVDVAGGLRLFVEKERVYLAFDEADLPTGAWPQFGEPLALQAGAFSLGNGWTLSVEYANPTPQAYSQNPDNFSAWLDADLTEGRLRVRSLFRGDRLEPLGMPGQRVKLSDLFINLKIPKRARKNWPLVCADDTILWVPGLRQGHACRVTGQTKRALVLRVQRANL